MDKYENLGLVGEGSYGMVLKCKHKESGQLVAIKKFIENEDDRIVKKIALREVKLLKQLHHDHLINLIEVFRRKKRLYLVFEFVDHTLLDELEKSPNGLDDNTSRKILWQVLKGTEFCHSHNIIHRDIKPENVLVSNEGIVKICDFGFARTLAQPGEAYTDYVATRWYRAPELLVGDSKYGKAVDIWAVGCLLTEMLTGEPLFPGDSDIDQLYHIIRCFGNLTRRHRDVFLRNPLFLGMKLPEVHEVHPLEIRFTNLSFEAVDFIKKCLKLDPDDRLVCQDAFKHNLFTRDGFSTKFSTELKQKLEQEKAKNPLYTDMCKTLQLLDCDSQDCVGTSKMGASTATAGKKKKKSVSKEDSSSFLFKEPGKESASFLAKDSLLKVDDDKKVKEGTSMEPSTAVPSIALMPDNEQSTPNKSCTSPNASGSAVSFPPAVNLAAREQEKWERERATPSVSPKISTIIPPINHNGQTYTPSTTYSSKGNPEKGLPKKGPNFVKKTSSTSCSPNFSTQGSLQSEKLPLHDKFMPSDKTKLKCSENSQQGSLSLPEVKRISETKNKTKKAPKLVKKTSNFSVPHIMNIDPFSANNSQNDSCCSDEEYLPVVM